MKPLLLFLISVQLCACSFFDKKKETADYIKWLQDESHGLIKEKHVNGLNLNVKYLPPEYLAYQELKNEKSYSVGRRDSLISAYSQSLTFLLSIATDEREKQVGDVMYLDLNDMQGYKERVQVMNFEMQDFLELKTNQGVMYKPVLTNMQNTYGLSNGRSITAVFVPLRDIKEFKEAESIDVVWDDDLFGSGRNHFVFESKYFWEVPALKF